MLRPRRTLVAAESRSAARCWTALQLACALLALGCGSATGKAPTPDSGTAHDAGEQTPPDAGAPVVEPDAGQPMPDAGPPEPPDAGPKDAGKQTPPPPPVDAGPPDAGQPKKAAWTMLVYMAADNNLEKYAIDDLSEMLAAKISDDVNVIVEVDRTSGLYELGVGGVANWQSVKRFKVTQGKLTELADLGELDTGAPNTLRDFIHWGLSEFPAERRFLVMWDHGNAWQGYGGDDTSDHDLLDQNELQTAVRDGIAAAGLTTVDLIGFDACLMSTFVNGLAMKPYTRYYLASEELSPGNGWDYKALLDYLSGHLDATPVSLGSTVVNTFYEQARQFSANKQLTSSLLDLSKIDALKSEFDELVTLLDQRLTQSKTEIAKARNKAVVYGYHSDPAHAYHMIDLGDFVTKLAALDSSFEALRDRMISTLGELVLASKYGANKQGSTGASIYFPTSQAFYKNGYDAVQEGIPWRELLKRFYALKDTEKEDPPAFNGQSVSKTTDNSGSSDGTTTQGDPSAAYNPNTGNAVDASPACAPQAGPRVSSGLQSNDVSKVANGTLVSGLVDSHTGVVHVFARQPAELDAQTGMVTGTWDRHVLVANQGAQQQLLFAEFTLDPDGRTVFADVPLLYSEPPSCRCALPGTDGYSDVDADGRPDCADGDVDQDGVPDKGPLARDNCRWIPNPGQEDTDGDGVGDACEAGSGAPMLRCNPAPSGEFGALDAAFWRVTVDRLNPEHSSARLFVATGAGVSELTPQPGALLWPRGLMLGGDGKLAFRTGLPLPFNLQQPIELGYEDVEQIYLRNEAGDTLLDAQLQPTKLIDRLGWSDLFMRIFVSDFAGRGGAAETQADFSSCTPPAPVFCTGDTVPDCDGRCLDKAALLPNGRCDDGSGGAPNLNCKLLNYDDGECVRPDCEAGYIRDCQGQCTLPASVIGNGTCDELAKCESLEYDGGDCPCGPDCSGHGSCGVSGCTCNAGYTGAYCQTGPSCGDGTCTLADGETCTTCQADCGACASTCGDGTCKAGDGETCTSCPADCGACSCGDGVCTTPAESCTSCPGDCGSCPVCGDLSCARHEASSPFSQAQAETCTSCASDCGACTGDCCVAAAAAGEHYVGGGCGQPAVSQCVCALRPECCTGGWTEECVSLAQSRCDLSCAACPAAKGGDTDGDGACGYEDNCPSTANAQQQDADSDTIGDACDVCPDGDDRSDPDGDGRPTACDNCGRKSNRDQADQDQDGIGDVCDACPGVSDVEQTDLDNDRVGDVCDNCPETSNASQADTDGDALGDACDGCPSDFTKTAPGRCGCGVSESDLDQDETPDCLDMCPNDPLNIAPPCACPRGTQDNDANGSCLPTCASALLDCGANGSCNDGTGTALCVCNPGYTGQSCATCASGYQDNDANGSCLPTCATAALSCGLHAQCADASGTPACSCLPGWSGSACDQPAEWLSGYGASQALVSAGGVAVDAQGNSYVFAQFGGADVSFGGATLSPLGATDCVLLSYDLDGALRWARQIGGTAADSAGKLALDASANVFVIGSTTSGSLSFDTTHSASGTGQNAFVASYDSAGNYRFGKVLGTGEGRAITTDAAGNVYASGWVNGSFDYGTGARGSGTGSIFLVSYDGAGATRWASVYNTVAPSGQEVNSFLDLTTDASGNLYAAGYIVAANGSLGGAALGWSGDAHNAVIASYTGAGVHRWSASFAGLGEARAIASTSQGRVAVATTHTGSASYGGPALTDPQNSGLAALVSFDAQSGAWQAQKGFTTGAPLSSVELAIDAQDNLYLAGDAGSSGVDFGAGAATSGPFVASYDSAFGYRFGRVASAGPSSNMNALAVGADGAVYLAGTTQTIIDWGVGLYEASGSQDLWHARLRPFIGLPVTAGLAAHYSARDAVSVALSGNLVTQWNDISGHTRHLAVNGGSPSFLASAAIGQNAAVDFQGGARLSSAPFQLTSEVTVLAVFQARASAQWGAIAHHGSRDSDWSIEQSGFKSADQLHFQSGNDNANVDLTFQNGASYVIAARVSAGQRYFAQYGSSGSNVVTGANVTIAPGNKPLYVGTSDNNEASNALIGELVYYDRALSDNELQSVVDSLKDAWSISSASNAYPLSCAAILQANPGSPSGQYDIDPDGSGPIVPFQAFCDMVTDGGGWTVVSAITGANDEQPLTSDVEVPGAPLQFGAYNLARAKKVALSSVSTESIFVRNDGTWLQANAPMFDPSLEVASSHAHYPVQLLSSDLQSAPGWMGWSNFATSGGGDFNVSTDVISQGVDHHNGTLYYHLNNNCVEHYLYSYSGAVPDDDAGYDVNTSLGAWSATLACDGAEGGVLTFYAAMR